MTVSSAAPPSAAPVSSPLLPGRHHPPLLGSYEQLGEVHPALRVRPGPPRTGDGWLPTSEVLRNPDALRELIAFDAREGLARYGEPLRPDVAAGFALHRYTWSVALLFTLPWLLERRVPRIPVERVSTRPGSGELTVQPAGFACLPDDPAAAAPGARVLADAAELRGELLLALTEHLTPVVAAFRPEVRRGPHTLWGRTTDDVIEGLWYLGSLLGAEERAAAALAELLPGAGPAPFVGGAGFRLLEHPGAAPMRTRTRASCCLFYTVQSVEACFSCPRKK